jgi:uncharacterized membrane protein YsdA (DUF1294 family)
MEFSFEYVGVALIVLINLFAFLVTGNDKRKSMVSGQSERTPERLLFFFATAFGSIGVYLAMIIFRHKTKKWYFQLGIPLLIAQNCATLYVLYLLLL